MSHNNKQTAKDALRELVDGYFYDGVCGKFPLTDLGKARREEIIMAERAELVAALRLGRSAEDHLARQALLRKLGAE